MRWRHLLMSLETEWQTLLADPNQTAAGVVALFEHLTAMAPTLPFGAGLLNAYGRIYLDGSHLELAAAEADSPYQLAQWIEQQETLLWSVVYQLKTEGDLKWEFRNVNYDGLLRDGVSSWGTHENYLLHGSPDRIAAAMLPFLATRLFAGAGALVWPSGEYVAGTRVELLSQDTGGGTSQQRALFSTARDESLTRDHRCRRLHLILGDGNRSQFSLALKMGTTALVARMLEDWPDAVRPLPGTPAPSRGRRAFWMQAARQFNMLARPGEPLRAAPLALRVQRMYHEACSRFVHRQTDVPDWVPRLLSDWEITLGALASLDNAWLQRRLDPWIKHELLGEYLRQHGVDWPEVLKSSDLFHELALLNQDYHSLDASSVFQRCNRAGLLDHRVVPCLQAGEEPEPFVPATVTRAAARARFIKQHALERGWTMDWMSARHMPTGRVVEFEPPIVGES